MKMEFTLQLRQAFGRGYEASLRFDHPHVSSGHILLGILALNRGASALLKQCGLSLDLAERYWLDHSIRAEETRLLRGLLAGVSLVAVMERAEAEARKGECKFIGTDHVLLGLADEVQGDARDLFDIQKVDRARLHELIVERLKVRFDFSAFEDA